MADENQEERTESVSPDGGEKPAGEDVDVTIDDSEGAAAGGDAEDEEDDASPEAGGRRNLALRIPLPFRLTPQQAGIALLALIGVGLGALATVQTREYRARFGVVMRAAQDPANFGYYREANAKVRTDRLYEPGTLTVVYGADLGHAWEMLRVLRGSRVINRSIAQQDMTELFLRFDQDVIGLHPRDVILLPPLRCVREPREMLVRLHLLAGAARAYGIRPVLATIPPIPADLDTLAGGYRGRITAVNRGIDAIAAATGMPVLDFFGALANDDHYLKADYCSDGALPNPPGYRIMTDMVGALVDSLRSCEPLAALEPLESFAFVFGSPGGEQLQGAETDSSRPGALGNASPAKAPRDSSRTVRTAAR
jgi:hypothetical protein